MAVMSRIIYFRAALLALPCVLAGPLPREASCDFGIQAPTNWDKNKEFQWCNMINQEVFGLEHQEDVTTVLPDIEAKYNQANIKADPLSAFYDLDQLTQDPVVRAALTQMKANAVSGNQDLTPEDIRTVYADGIKAASAETGVSEDMMVHIIFTESKGQPLVYGTLTQVGHVEWGLMADKNSDLKNRYMPGDNIMASAMYLKGNKDGCGCSWEEAYTGGYQKGSGRA